MKIPDLERMTPHERRRFLKLLGSVFGAAFAEPALRFACNQIAGGEAYAQATEANQPTFFIELNLRDQWDHGHVFVAPGMATDGNLRRGDWGDLAALYYGAGELVERAVNGTRVFLTNESRVLEPHLDNIAMIDTCEVAQGAIHGHESGNPMRSPGRSYERTSGKLPMYENDPVDNFPAGVEAYHSSTPTPASLHNYLQKQLTPGLHNGFAFKGISRGIHTAYHFGAGLPGAELDRKQSIDSLHQAFPDRLEDFNILGRREDAEAFGRILARIDRKYLDDRSFAAAAKENHDTILTEARQTLCAGEPRLYSLRLTAAEIAYWSADVPGQMANPASIKGEIWQQMGYAQKVLVNQMARTVALEFDCVDVHGPRDERIVRNEAAQTCIPLARVIEQLKAANLWSRSLIAIYTTDGSRTPGADSFGSEGKNTVILAGGMIRGGYYGDIRQHPDGGYEYFAPDPTTGAPGGSGSRDNGGRLESARVWRTVAKALRIPDALCDQFPDVAAKSPLPFLLL